ncbi:MAG: hypothetical protein QM756_44695 [Polyangiaceae bacterium]
MIDNVFPKPIDPVFTRKEAILFWWENPGRICINLRDGEPPMPGSWQPRMKLDGATLYVHPGNERRGIRRLQRGY